MKIGHFLDRPNWKSTTVNIDGVGEVTGFFLRTEQQTLDFRFYTTKSTIPGAGHGLFAARDFDATRGGATLCVYAGKEVALDAVGDYVMKVTRSGTPVRVDSEGRAWDWSPAKFINSTCGPNGATPSARANARIAASGAIKQIKKMKKGDEIFMSYGNQYWARRGKRT